MEIKNEARRTEALRQIGKIVRRNRLNYIKRGCIEDMKRYAEKKQLGKVKQDKADELRTRLLLWTYFRALEKFMHMKVKKLDNIRRVNEYLHEKRRKRAVAGLRRNLD